MVVDRKLSEVELFQVVGAGCSVAAAILASRRPLR